ncbi:ferric reductase-like transmembrane domain-containing protein [soil metagenome]
MVTRALRRRYLVGTAWVTLYLVVTLAPLLVIMLTPSPPGRGFWTEFSAAIGFAGLSMLGLQFALTSRFRGASAPYGMDLVLQFHRQISLLAAGLIVAHVAILFISRPETVELLNVVEAPWRARFGVLGLLGLVVLIVLSLWRVELRMRYESWRITHGLLAVAILGLGAAHVIGVGHFLELFWKQVLWIILALGAIGLFLYIRVARPAKILHQPWVVDEVIEERGNAHTLRLRPVDHPGMSFEPGQFAWITVGRSPFGVREHPISFSSSAEAPERPALTIKALGDFTSTVGDIEPGTIAFLDGPHGVFIPRRMDADAFFFIAGGIGITPIMSILRTFADRGDERPLTLVYASEAWDAITFREEIDELGSRLPLKVIHVLRKPPDHWTGEEGYVDQPLIERHLPDDHESVAYLLCGPDPVTDAAEEALLELGVPHSQIRIERFDVV